MTSIFIDQPPLGSGGTVTGTTTTTTTSTTLQAQVTLQYDTTQGNVDVLGGLVGNAGRTVTLTALPLPGYVFSYWETVTAPPPEDVTFGVFSGFGTINGRSRPFIESVPFGSVIPVTCIAADGYQFDSAETFDIAGNSLGQYVYPDFSVIANGQLDEVRVYFTSTTVTPAEPTNTTTTVTGTTTETTGGGVGTSTTTTTSPNTVTTISKTGFRT